MIAAKSRKPEKLGTVWSAWARIRFIDATTQRWVTVESCIDTPWAINNAFAKARRSHPNKTLWVHSDVDGIP